MSAIISFYGTNFFGHLGIPFLGLFVVWWSRARRVLAMMAAIAVLLPSTAGAYYDKTDYTDYTEAYTILPNETGFLEIASRTFDKANEDASTIRALAADALRSCGQKTDGRLPSTIVGLPPELGPLMSTLLRFSASEPPRSAPIPAAGAVHSPAH